MRGGAGRISSNTGSPRWQANPQGAWVSEGETFLGWTVQSIDRGGRQGRSIPCGDLELRTALSSPSMRPEASLFSVASCTVSKVSEEALKRSRSRPCSPAWHPERGSATRPLLQPAVDLMQEPADAARPELYALRKLSVFFETEYVLRRIWHDQTKLFLRYDPWELIIDIGNSSRLVDQTRTVTWRSGPTPFIHRLSLSWTLNSSVDGWLVGYKRPSRLNRPGVHTEVEGHIAEADNARLHGPGVSFVSHSVPLLSKMVTSGDRPRLRFTTISLAISSDRRARYLALRSRPKRRHNVLLS